MRVITGSFRGRKLKSLDGTDVRPTADMVKEAMFSAVQFELEGRTVADLFAGTGQLGIEALSRGAAKVYFVDNNRSSIDVLKENITTVGLGPDAAVVKEMPASAFLRSVSVPIDIAFLDPPYERGHIQKLLPKLTPAMSERGIIVCEHETGCRLPEESGGFRLAKTYKYGKTGVTIYRAQEKDGEADS